MQFKQTLVRLFFLLTPFTVFSQATTYLPQDARESILLERLEIKAQTDSVLNFSKIKPFSRRNIVYDLKSNWNRYKYGEAAHHYYMDQMKQVFTPVDNFNFFRALENNSEYFSDSISFKSKKTFLKNFYKSPANFYEVHNKDFFLALNPVLQFYLGKENNNDERIFLNSRGVTLRGSIANKIGFAAYVADNQERDPLYVQQMVTAHKAVPGAGFYKPFKTTGYDYFDARGYITLNAIKAIDIQFGYDKNFIGNGFRSLFLSDFSAPYLFLKLNTRIWKFNYQNLFMELQTTGRLPGDQLIPKKYAAMHHLDVGITKWLNVGFFEAILFGRKDHFEFGYLNPVIFYRSLEQQNGSFDNALVGLDAKANVAHKFQFYGQLLLDEFNLSELRKHPDWWGNKFGYQLGAKYIDAFNIKNLDLQVESNRVRPFTYSHGDSVSNYTHYNQPLAHPLGANFQELIGIARFQPAPKWFLQAKAIYFMQGKDTGNTSFGSNIFLPYLPPYRTQEYGFNVGGPIKGKTTMASMLVSYEWKPNFFFELSAVLRKESPTTIGAAKNTSIIYAGFRWNMQRREFDF
ncbi:MAG TPA: hypothetical protein VNT20_11490 [Flavisolibacter sp.]|jgi:hypothetical protein|nr:hypothetical protein [Flavisolibacter sp.]